MKQENENFSPGNTEMYDSVPLSLNTNSVSKRVEVRDRINHGAMIQQMRSIFSQSPVTAS